MLSLEERLKNRFCGIYLDLLENMNPIFVIRENMTEFGLVAKSAGALQQKTSTLI